MLQRKQKQSRRLKNKITQETSSSFESGNPSTIQIHVEAPKDERKFNNQQEQSRVYIMASNDSFQGNFSQQESKLMQIPHLTTKKQEQSLYDTRNFESFLKSTNKGHKKENKEKDRNQQFAPKINFTKILTSGITDEAEMIQLIKTQRKEAQAKISNQRPIQRQKQMKQQKNGQLLKRYGSLGSFIEHQSQKQKINSGNVEEEYYPAQDHKSEKNLRRPLVNRKQPEEKLQLKKPELKTGRRKCQKVEEIDKNERMKLKDYIYKTEFTKQNAMLRRKETIDEAIKSKGKNQKETLNEKKALEKKYSTITSDYRSQKYEVTNKKMSNVLKHDICVNIKKVIGHLQELGEDLKTLEFDSEPSNNQLATLYNVRRMLKEQVGSKVLELQEDIHEEKDKIKKELEDPAFAQI